MNLDPFVTKKVATGLFESAAKLFFKVTKLNIENGNNNMPTKQQQQQQKHYKFGKLSLNAPSSIYNFSKEIHKKHFDEIISFF